MEQEMGAKKDGGNIKVTNREALELMGNVIWTNRNLPVKTRYWLSRIADKLKSIANAAAKERTQIINDFCVKDEKGNPKKSADNKLVFDPPEKEAEANAAIKELYDIANELPWPRQIIDIGNLSDAFELSAADMVGAELVVEFVFNEPAPAAATPPPQT
jgi:hypothetical protein